MKKEDANIHHNLMDVTEEWKERRHQRVMQIKDEWMEIIKIDIRRRFQDKEYEIFKKNV